MNYEKRTDLPNGITVVTETLNDYESVSIGIWLEQGSRDEHTENNGVSHYFEHMVFKGTEHYSALDLVSEIEGKGGYLNAYTTREHTCFYAKVIHRDLYRAVDILCELVAKPRLEKTDFEKEREVILEEIQGYFDQPDEWVYDLLLEKLYPGNPLGFAIAGSLETVEKLTHSQLLEHWQKQTTQGRWVISAAGRVDHDQLVEWVVDKLGVKVSADAVNREIAASVGGSQLVGRDLNQSTLAIGTSFQNLSFKDRLALNVIHQMLGEGMSSRLFQNIREAHGLVYNIYTGVDFFARENLFTLSMAAEPKRMKKAIELLNKEMKILAEKGWQDREVEWAKGALSGGMVMHRESTSNRMTSLTRRAFSSEPHLGFVERLKAIEEIEKNDLEQWTQRLVCADWAGAMIHPHGKGFALDESLRF